MHGIATAGMACVTRLLGLYNVREGDEAESSHIGGVEAAIVGRGIFLVRGEAGKIIGPGAGRLVRNARHGYCSRLVTSVGDDFYRVGAQVVIGNGLRRGIENWGNVVLGRNVTRDSGRVRDQHRAFLHVALEDLAPSG